MYHRLVPGSIRSRPGEGPCHPRLVQVVTTSIRSRPREGPCHPRLVPGRNC